MEIFSNEENKILDGVRTSGRHYSFWLTSTEPIKFAPLRENLDVDVVVIGGGIAGITTAYLLSKSDRTVALVEDGYIGSGETGRTTAHLVNALDDRYTDLEKYFGQEGSMLAGESHTLAINFIEEVIKEEKIDCDFERVDGYLFLHETDKKKTLDDELDATHRASIDTEMVSSVPGITNYTGPALVFPRQAMFHPLKYLSALSNLIVKNGGKIFTETHVKEIDNTGIKTDGGNRITARNIVVATNTPINDTFTMHTKQAPYRTYVLGIKIPKNVLKRALWWDTGDQNSKWPNYPYHYVRLQNYNDAYDLLIVGGEDHKTGQAEVDEIYEENRYILLEEWARKYFPAAQDVAFKWSGQVMEPVDSLAFIGKNPGDDNIYICTGDSGNGMTHGTIAGIILTDLILGKHNRWQELYDPSRKNAKSVPTYIKEQANVAKKYVVDFLSEGEVKSVKDIKPGDGAVIRDGLTKAAVYRDEKGQFHTYSAVCKHLKCIVHWNRDEKTFDCPCHGSRYTCYGTVVNGPAKEGLDIVEINLE